MIEFQSIREHSAIEHYRPDLESAFNDGYELKPQSRADLSLSWAFFGWCVVALLTGTWVMVDVILTSLAGLAARVIGWIS